MSKRKRARENALTRRTHEKLIKLAEVMGYTQTAHGYGAVQLTHKDTMSVVNVQVNCKRPLTAKEWHECYTNLMLGATAPNGISKEPSPGSTDDTDGSPSMSSPTDSTSREGGPTTTSTDPKDGTS